MDLHNGLDIEVYDLRPTNLHYYYYYYYYFKILSAACNMLRENISIAKCRYVPDTHLAYRQAYTGRRQVRLVIIAKHPVKSRSPMFMCTHTRAVAINRGDISRRTRRLNCCHRSGIFLHNNTNLCASNN